MYLSLVEFHDFALEGGGGSRTNSPKNVHNDVRRQDSRLIRWTMTLYNDRRADARFVAYLEGSSTLLHSNVLFRWSVSLGSSGFFPVKSCHRVLLCRHPFQLCAYQATLSTKKTRPSFTIGLLDPLHCT